MPRIPIFTVQDLPATRVAQNPPDERYTAPRVRIALVKEADLDWPAKYINNPEDVFNISRAIFDGLDREAAYVFMLDQKNKLLGINLVSIGSLTEALIHPRELFKAIILLNAASFIFVHNHPSGDPTPSRADRQLAGRMKSLATLMGILLKDCIICGDTYYSFAVSGALDATASDVIQLDCAGNIVMQEGGYNG
jgi:DNA repair protein RadC